MNPRLHVDDQSLCGHYWHHLFPGEVGLTPTLIYSYALIISSINLKNNNYTLDYLLVQERITRGLNLFTNKLIFSIPLASNKPITLSASRTAAISGVVTTIAS